VGLGTDLRLTTFDLRLSRRAFLGLAAGALASHRAFAQPDERDGWRQFEIVTRVEILQPDGITRVWLPTPLVDAPYQRTSGDTYRADGGFVEMIERPAEGIDVLMAQWPAGHAPILKLTSRVATRDHHTVDLTTPSVPPPVDMRSFERLLRPTRHIPTDGIVKETAARITRGAGTDLERARAIYDWVVENTFRDPKIRGGGAGDIRVMLESGHLGGQCADLNTLFVGLCRASGVPARDVYGLRIAPTRFDAKTLGLSSDDATRAQHCRAEVYLTGFGWVPVDPADVRQVVLEEPPGNRSLTDPLVGAVRQRLFGSWEMNWIAFNTADDVQLPGTRLGTLNYFMYPQAETAVGRIDSLDPDGFEYSITVREL
jgi:transglutaminase-like putative cysteine protease